MKLLLLFLIQIAFSIFAMADGLPGEPVSPEMAEKMKTMGGPVPGPPVFVKTDTKWMREHVGEDQIKKSACDAYISASYAQMRVKNLEKLEPVRDLTWDENQDLIRNRRVFRNDAPRANELARTYLSVSGHKLNVKECD